MTDTQEQSNVTTRKVFAGLGVLVGVGFLVLRKPILRAVNRNETAGLSYAIALSVLLLALTFLWARPSVKHGRASRSISIIPFLGLVLAAICNMIWPHGHPITLGVLIWRSTGFLSLVAVPMALVRLRKASWNNENRAFVVIMMCYLMVVGLFTFGLLPFLLLPFF
jgi:hypothetical protein